MAWRQFDQSGNRLLSAHERFQSSYIGNLAQIVHDGDKASEVVHVKELYHHNDPEAVIRLFESQPSLRRNSTAVSEYVKALVQVDRLDGSELLKTLQRGISNTSREEEGIGSFSAFRNAGKSVKDGVLRTANASIHMVATERGHFKE